jgi:ATP/maltotriose-dependent transcriptional regulator MalT
VRPFPDPKAVVGDASAKLQRGDPAAALAVLRPVAFALAAESGAGFRDLVERLPVELWQHDPLLAAALGHSYRAADAPGGAAGLAYFAAAEDAAAADPATPAHVVAAVLVSHAGGLRAAGRLEQAREKLSGAEAIIDAGLDGPVPATMELRARHALERGLLDLHGGRYTDARERLLTARGLASHLSRAGSVECAGALALLEFALGDLVAAERFVDESRELAAGTMLERSGYAAPAIATRLLLDLDREADDAPADRQALTEASAHTEWEAYAALLAGARLAADGRPTEALDLLAGARRGFRAWQVAGFGRDLTEIVRASQLAAVGRGDEAWEVLSRLRPGDQHVVCPGVHLAAHLLAGGDLHGAARALAACEAVGDIHGTRALLEARLLRGAIAAALGDRATSDVSVDLAFIGMARTGSRSPLRLVPAGLLGSLAERALEREHSDEVRALIERARRAADGAQPAIEPLSIRERLVLAEAQHGATVSAIAAAMFISPNTVKTHLRRVYRKLGVTTREEAIRKARTLGLHEITRDSPVPRKDDTRGT